MAPPARRSRGVAWRRPLPPRRSRAGRSASSLAIGALAASLGAAVGLALGASGGGVREAFCQGLGGWPEGPRRGALLCAATSKESEDAAAAAEAAAAAAEAAAKEAEEAVLMAKAQAAAAESRRQLLAAKAAAAGEAPPAAAPAAPPVPAPVTAAAPAPATPAAPADGAVTLSDLGLSSEGGYVGMDTSVGEAIVQSKTFKEAAEMLAKLERLPAGGFVSGMSMRLITVIDRSKVEYGRPGANWKWDEILTDKEVWRIAKTSYEDAEKAFKDALDLCGSEDSPATEFRVDSRSGLTFQGTYDGMQSTLQLQQSDQQLGWGKFSSYVVIQGPDALIGQRAVRRRGASPGKPPPETDSGDVLLFAAPDRAAFLAVVDYDSAPTKYAKLGKLMEAQENMKAAAGDQTPYDLNYVDSAVTDAMKPLEDPEVKEAVTFSQRLKNLPNNGTRVTERFRRLMKLPAMQKVAARVREDEDLQKVAGALEPYAERLYAEARSTWVGVEGLAEEPEVAVISIELDPAQAIFVLVGFLVVLYAVFSLCTSVLSPPADDFAASQQSSLPTYSLRGGDLPAGGMGGSAGSTMYTLKSESS